MTTLKQLLQDQLNAIPSLNEYFNRLPSNTKNWIVEAEIQAVKEWLKQKHEEWRKGFQYDEFFPKDVIPALLEELKGES